jgi:hypothetical protein
MPELDCRYWRVMGNLTQNIRHVGGDLNLYHLGSIITQQLKKRNLIKRLPSRLKLNSTAEADRCTADEGPFPSHMYKVVQI